MKTRKKFSKEFKLKAIKMSNRSDNIKDVAISLGIREALLYCKSNSIFSLFSGAKKVSKKSPLAQYNVLTL